MEKNVQSNRKVLWIAAVAVLFTIYFAINYLTPAVADDYNYLGHWQYNSNEKIHSIGGFWQSACQFYCLWGGRVISYAFAVLLTFLHPVVFDLLNTAVHLLVTFLMYKICVGARKNNLLLFIGIHILLWLSVPDYGQIFFWTSGTASYLWTSVFVLSIILLFRWYAVKSGDFCRKNIYAVFTVPAGLIAGAAMENMSAGMLVVLTLYLLYYKKQNIKIAIPILGAYVAGIVGFAFLILAPGNGVRADAEESLGFLFKISIFAYYWMIFFTGLCIVWICLYVYIRMKQNEKTICGQSVIFAIGAFCSAGCLVFAPTLPERAWYTACVFLIIASGICFAEIHFEKEILAHQIVKILAAGGALYCLVSAADTALYSLEIYQQTKSRETYILQEKAKGNLDITVPVITHRYPLRSKHDALTGLSDIQEDPTYWINVAVARYYGVNTITGVEE